LIGDADILIAATAIVADCALVTNNERHFNRIQDLRVENWLRMK
jgi:predicted nucleic acid-binding protein